MTTLDVTTATPPLARAGGTPPGVRLGVVTAFPPSRGSLNEYGLHLVRHLAVQPEIGEVVVVADRVDGTADPTPAPSEGVRVLRCWSFNDVRAAVSIVRAVRREHLDAVLLNLQFATFGDRRVPGALGLLTPWLLRRLGVTTVVVLHNLADNVDLRDAGFARSRIAATAMRTAGRLLTRALLRADLVALTIPRYVEFVRDRYDADNVVLAPHGSFSEPTEVDLGVPAGPPRVLAFGKWGTYKTVDMLVDAHLQLRATGHPDVELVLAGTDSPNSPGYMAEVARRYADVPGLRLTGYVAEHDVPALFAGATVVAFPYTSTTGSSGVLHQAGEYGRAAVLPRLGDLVDVIEEEGFRGEYFDPELDGDLAMALCRVLDDPVRRTELGRRNAAAAAGIPMAEVAHWYVLHLGRLLGTPAVSA